jgi:hypothetical protein
VTATTRRIHRSERHILVREKSGHALDRQWINSFLPQRLGRIV